MVADTQSSVDECIKPERVNVESKNRFCLENVGLRKEIIVRNGVEREQLIVDKVQDFGHE
jgi:hypothetical protein